MAEGALENAPPNVSDLVSDLICTHNGFMQASSPRSLALPVLTGAYVLSQFYRSYVAVIATQLIDDFGFTPQMFGFFAGAFYFTFAIAQLPLGIAFDRFGVRRPVLFCIALGSVGAIALPLTHSIPVAIFSQVALGIGCAPLYMGLLNFVLKSGNGPRQVRIVTLASALGYLGAIVAGLPLAWGVASFGWRASVMVMGLLMVLATVGIFLTLKEAPVPAVSGDTPQSASTTSTTTASPKQTTASRIAFSALVLVCFALLVGGTFRMSWGGPYLSDIFQFDVIQRGYAMTSASLVAMCWALLMPRALRLCSVKMLIACAFAVGMSAALVLMAAPALNAYLAVALICVMFCAGSVHPLVMSQARSVVPARRLGLWLGVLNSMVFLGVAVSNSSFGWIAERAVPSGLPLANMYGSMFAFTAVIMCIGLISSLFSPATQRATGKPA